MLFAQVLQARAPARTSCEPFLLFLSLLVVAGCGDSAGKNGGSGASATCVQFADATGRSGIAFRHTNAATGQKYLPETYSGGVAFLDYDNDGYLDIYFVDGGELPGFKAARPMKNRLYRNRGDGTFVDVTDRAGVGGIGADGKKLYGMGCCAADYDNDGNIDIYVTNYGPNQLYRNNGDGTFTEVAKQAGVADSGFSLSSAFGDYDSDGFVDLYVCNYLKFDPARDNKVCTKGGSALRYYCDPSVFRSDPDRLYHNNGDGSFTDVTEKAGVYNTTGQEMGVVWGDYDNDGDQDIYVASDRTPNFLYRNNGNGTFSEVGLQAGVAYNEDGLAQAGMGVDLGDYDEDGLLDIFVTNFQAESNILYRNNGNGTFSDVTFDSGLGAASLPFLSFGTGFLDYDNDGLEDIFVASGHVDDNIASFDPTVSYAQTNQLFRNDGRSEGNGGHVTFTDVSSSAGPGLRISKVSRGAAFGDYDNDGDIDIVVGNCNDRADLLRNDGGNTAGNWLSVRLVGTRSNRSAIGARVIATVGGRTMIDEVRSGGSYASHSDLRLHFGLGSHHKVDSLEIRWPSGLRQTISDVQAGQTITLKEAADVQ